MTPHNQSISDTMLSSGQKRLRKRLPVSDVTKQENIQWRNQYLISVANGSAETERVCVRCEQPLPLSFFGKNSSVKFGFHYWCKKCNSSIGKNYYHEVQKPKAELLNGRIRKRGWFQRNIKMWEARAKDKGVPFGLKVSDLLDSETGLLPSYCRVFPHIRLDYDAGTDHRIWASLDRIVPKLGYVSGNVWVISMAANTWKSNGSNRAERERIVEIMTGKKHWVPPVDTGQGSLFHV